MGLGSIFITFTEDSSFFSSGTLVRTFIYLTHSSKQCTKPYSGYRKLNLTQDTGELNLTQEIGELNLTQDTGELNLTLEIGEINLVIGYTRTKPYSGSKLTKLYS